MPENREQKRGKLTAFGTDLPDPERTQNGPLPCVFWGKHKRKRPTEKGWALNGGGLGRKRTTDTRIFSPLLYRLSYRAKGAKYSRGGALLWLS